MEGRVLGIYNFFGASLSWMPSLLFGATYQGTGSMRLGMALVCVFHAIACVGVGGVRGRGEGVRGFT